MPTELPCKVPSRLSGLRVLQVIDSDPLNYPPTINAGRVLAAAGAQVICLGGMRMARPMVALPSGLALRYEAFGSWGQKGLRQLQWGIGRLSFRRAVERAVEELQPELVIAYDPGAGWAVLPLLRRREGPRLVFHLHDNENPQHHHWRSVRTWQWRSVVRRMGAFTARVVPDAMRAEELQRAWGLTVPFHVAANAPPREFPSRNDVLRNRLNLGGDVKIAIVVGNMGMLGLTARALARTESEWHLVVVGAQDPLELASLAQESSFAKVERRVHVLPYTDYDTMRSWLRGCHAGLAFYPCDSRNVNWRLMGSASVKVMEYVAAGIPSIVCSRAAFSTLAGQVQALEVLEDESEDAIVRSLAQLDVASVWPQRCAAAIAAHLARYNTEAQLAPLLRDLGYAPPAEWSARAETDLMF